MNIVHVNGVWQYHRLPNDDDPQPIAESPIDEDTDEGDHYYNDILQQSPQSTKHELLTKIGAESNNYKLIYKFIFSIFYSIVFSSR